MPSVAIQTWSGKRLTELNATEVANRSWVRGRQNVAAQQLLRAYTLLLSSQFQGFCRDLHTECIDHLIRAVIPTSLRAILRDEFQWNRKLDSGNPTPGNIGLDFGRLGMSFWPDLDAADSQTPSRRILLEEMNRWRNAIAHQDFDPAKLGGTVILGVAKVRKLRVACNRLALTFDRVTRIYVETIIGAKPW